MPANNVELLEEALSVSQQMCAAARAGDWEQVAKLTPRRHSLMRRGFACGENPASDKSPPASMLDALTDCDRLLLGCARNEHKRCSTQVHKQSQRRRASNLYRSVGRS